MKPTTKRHFFLADDDSDDREMFSQALRMIDKDIILTEISDGIHLMESLSIPSLPTPEIVFLDVNMPKKSGLECLAEIKSQQTRIKDIRIVILSTSNMPVYINNAFTNGASFYAIKPSSFNSLKSIIEKVIGYNWSKPISKKDFLLVS